MTRYFKIKKWKRILCASAMHRYRKMHKKFNKRIDAYVYVYKCIRCGKIKTVKVPWFLENYGIAYKGGRK